MSENVFPKLRAIDARLFLHEGRPSILLLDPLNLSDKQVILPRQLAPLLSLCDGTRDRDELRAVLAVRFGLRIEADVLQRVLNAFDNALLLDNGRFAQAQERLRDQYRQAPFRSSSLAGRSYPADPDALRRLLQSYMDGVDEEPAGTVDYRGLVSPHIDYARGGAVYASVWKRAAEAVREAELIILLGTDHFGGIGRFTLTRQNYATPFGRLPTERDVVDALTQAMGEEEAFAEELHHRSEHSIELAAAWLQFIRDGEPCDVVPILCGSFSHFVNGGEKPEQDQTLDAMLDALKPVLEKRRTLVVAAGDLAHVGPAFGGRPQGLIERGLLRAVDDELIAQICRGDAEGFYAVIEQDRDRYNVCGLPPIYAALRLLGSSEGELTAYELCPADERNTSLVSVCGIVLA